MSYTLSKPSKSEVFKVFLFSVIVVFNQLKVKFPKKKKKKKEKKKCVIKSIPTEKEFSLDVKLFFY